jgi:hypothetical protein
VPGTKDERIAALAELQCGAVTNRQLRGSGLSAKDIKVRRERGTLRSTSARGVYRIAGSERTWRQDLWVAVLAGPSGTLASHLSAAALRDLVTPPSIPHVTVPRTASGRFGGAVVHHGVIDAVDRERYSGLNATALCRTLVDCAVVLDQKALNKLVDAAFGKRLCTYPAVLHAWERASPVRNGSRLEAALAPYALGARPVGVAASQVLRRICEWQLPMPVCEYEIRDQHGEWVATVDFAWPAWWFVLEYDGRENHGLRQRRFDRRRQAAVEALGYRVERADSDDLRPSSLRLPGRWSPENGAQPVEQP